METTINQRLEILIKELGLSANSFSKKLDLNPNVIYNSLKDKSKPGFDVLNKIVEAFDVNPDWLMKNVTPDDTPILRHENRHKVCHKSQKNTLNKEYYSDGKKEYLGDFKKSHDVDDKFSSETIHRFNKIIENDEELGNIYKAYSALRADLTTFSHIMLNDIEPTFVAALRVIEARNERHDYSEKQDEIVIKILSRLKPMMNFFQEGAHQINELILQLKALNKEAVVAKNPKEGSEEDKVLETPTKQHK